LLGGWPLLGGSPAGAFVAIHEAERRLLGWARGVGGRCGPRVRESSGWRWFPRRVAFLSGVVTGALAVHSTRRRRGSFGRMEEGRWNALGVALDNAGGAAVW